MYTMQEPTHEAASTGTLGRHRAIAYEPAGRRLPRKREAAAKEEGAHSKRLAVREPSAGPGSRRRLGPVRKAAQLRVSDARKKRGCRKSGAVGSTWVPMDTDSAASDDVELLIGLFWRFGIGENRTAHETLP